MAEIEVKERQECETAISRLTAWVRDYGPSRGPVFIDDVTTVLLCARLYLASEQPDDDVS